MNLQNQICIKSLSVFVCTLLLIPKLEISANDKFGTPVELSHIDRSKFIELSELSLPEYPTKAIAESIETDVWVRAQLNDKKKPDTVEIVHCDKPGYGFEVAAIKAAFNSVFSDNKINKKNRFDWFYFRIPFIIAKSPWYPPYSDSSYQVSYHNWDSTEQHTFPEMINRSYPSMPKKARDNNVSGMVYVRVLVHGSGVISKVVVLRTSDPHWQWGINESAVEAAGKCRFKPATRENKPVKVWVSFPYQFIVTK